MGGWAALVAASRTPQIYQCVIAGAAVSDPIMLPAGFSLVSGFGGSQVLGPAETTTFEIAVAAAAPLRV